MTATDIETWDVLAIWVTQDRSGCEAIRFMREVPEHWGNKPLVNVDTAGWCRWVLNSLGVLWEHRTFGPRNPIELRFGMLKQKIWRFHNRWPHNAEIEQVNNWIQSFASCYYIQKEQGELKLTFVQILSKESYIIMSSQDFEGIWWRK